MAVLYIREWRFCCFANVAILCIKTYHCLIKRFRVKFVVHAVLQPLVGFGQNAQLFQVLAGCFLFAPCQPGFCFDFFDGLIRSQFAFRSFVPVQQLRKQDGRSRAAERFRQIRVIRHGTSEFPDTVKSDRSHTISMRLNLSKKYICPLPVTRVVSRTLSPSGSAITLSDTQNSPISIARCMGMFCRVR